VQLLVMKVCKVMSRRVTEMKTNTRSERHKKINICGIQNCIPPFRIKLVLKCVVDKMMVLFRLA
jgi:hypothetical protein